VIKLIRFLKPYKLMIVGAVLLLFIQASCDLALPDYMADIVNTGVMSGGIQFILEVGLKMIGITMLGMTASVAVGFLAAMTAAGVAHDLRKEIFGRIATFTNAEFDQFSTASLITRTTNDITQIQTVLALMIRLVFYAPILGIGGTIKAVQSSASMSWIIGIAVFSLLVSIGILFSIVMPKFKMVQKLVDRLNLVTRENIEGMLVIRAFNAQKFEHDRFEVANRNLTETNLFVNRVMVIMMPLMMLIMNLVSVTIVWVGAKHVSSFQMNIGDMMAYMQYAIQIIMAFLMMSMMFIMVPRAAVSADRVAEVLKTLPSIRDSETPTEFSKDFSGEITFKDVSFAYPGGQDHVLHHLNFTAKPGETTAIIGATGSGKSTLVNLIMRFYDVSSGEILVDGINIKSVKRKHLREKIGFVPQKSVLFSGTIESNLKYADKNANEDDVIRASAIAQATEFIEQKEERYKTPISQGGTNVSGGQKQRLSIARALMKKAPIAIFDDSFSALDVKTDRKLREALKKETGESTIIIVAQRVSTIMNAAQILVLDNGHIVGKGTHDELLIHCDVYKEIARSQLSEEELAS